jgi:hypothetical protein
MAAHIIAAEINVFDGAMMTDIVNGVGDLGLGKEADDSFQAERFHCPGRGTISHLHLDLLIVIAR